MKILLIDTRYLEQQNTGIAVGLKAFLIELEGLIDLKKFKIYLLYQKEKKYNFDSFEYIQTDAKLFSIKEQLEFYKIFKTYNIDIFYSHHFVSPIFKYNVKVINVIHDLIPYKVDVLSPLGKLYYKIMNSITMKYSDVIAANSYATKNDIQDIFKRKDIKVIYHSYNRNKLNIFDDNILDKLNLQGDSYFLFVSSLKKHKNYKRVIEAFKQFNNDKNYKLILVGKDNQNISNDEILFTGYISDEELNSLYRNASALIFPSLIEGFGLPILEAQCHQCPVITSNISSMPEVAGKGAIFVNPYDINDIENAFNLVLDKSIRDDLIKKGKENLKRFSWKSYTEEIIKIFEELS